MMIDIIASSGPASWAHSNFPAHRGGPADASARAVFQKAAMTFKALLASKTGDTIATSLVDFKDEDLMPGDVTVAVEYST